MLALLRTSRLPWIAAIAHIGLVALTIAGILGGSEPDWPMVWIGFLVLDFPVGVLYVALNSLTSAVPSHLNLVPGYSPVNDVWNFLAPVGFFGLVGSAWWFFVVRWFQRRKARHAAGA
jgi:hypothetical protein